MVDCGVSTLGQFNKWDGTLSPTLRNIIKNACTWKYGASVVNKETKVGDLRKVLKKNRIVQPAEWFEYMLVEGCLWLNTALTTGTHPSLLCCCCRCCCYLPKD